MSPADMELKDVTTNGNDGDAYVKVGEEDLDGPASRTQAANETDGLLRGEISDKNGDGKNSGPAPESRGNPANTCSVSRIMRQMNEVIYKKVRLWMVVVFVLLLIAAVIIISMLVCSAIHEDVDEKFDPALFTAPRCFNGSFQLPNMVFTEELSSNQSQELEVKLADLFKSSPALGRYFSRAEINSFRNDPVVADYQLTFFMPEDERDQLSAFTLSREMVYNVFRQFLYDQDSDPSELTYINPLSLQMF
ncbi:hypothetical protein Q5P01_009698 [Channa striata]|uniref:SEA domain-containing protein n=1 Tax=Channa striata TaxID=64152 RepID=A0AA88SR21_CHASR|nr:hypothetical protein Q5P01_009698 [Channa striata]